MGMRISNSTISRNYTRSLQKNFARVADLNYKATSWRKFSTMAEDPVSGVRAFELRRGLARLETNRDNANTALGVIKAAEGQLAMAHDITKEFHERILQGNNGTSGPDERQIIANELKQKRDQMLTIMNGRFSDRYLFGGLDIENPPFDYGEETFNPTMTNANAALDQMKAVRKDIVPANAVIDGAVTAIETALGSSDGTNMATVQGDIDSVLAGLPAAEQALLGDAFADMQTAADALADVSVTSALRYQGYDVATTLNPDSPYFDQGIYDLTQRDYYIDVGLGVAFDGDDIDPNTAYTQSFNGLEIFGGGGKNIILQMDEIIAELESPDFNAEELGRMLGEPNDGTGFLSTADDLNLQVVKIGADTNYLEFVVERYNDEEINLTERQTQVELVDPAKAIMDYELQYTAYQAALQMGQRLLMPTLWDFVK